MLVSTALILAASFLPQPIEGRNQPRNLNPVKRTVSKASGSQVASDIIVSSNVLTLTSRTATTGYNRRSAAHVLGLDYTNGSSASLISLFEGEEFATNIEFGSQTFEVIVDTGSSDTWLVETNFTCTDLETGEVTDEAECAFGPTFTPDSSFVQIPDVNFNITYGDGEYLTGIFGYEQVTLANITVNQTVAVVNEAAWEGDNTTSGLTGFAYPAITSQYAGTDPADDTTQILYNPIFTTMYTDGLVSPLFSLAILRDLEGPSGYLALGGVPPIDFVQNFTSTPILITTIEYYPDALDFYTINIEGIVLNGKTLAGSDSTKDYIVDSGTTLNYLPTVLADEVNAAFIPAAVYSEDDGAYIVDCNAKPPTFAVKINGTNFYTNPLDMILPAGTNELGKEVCISGIDDGGSAADDVYILGDTFQKNVVSVFDVGAGLMQFASREYYASDDTY